MLPMKKLFPSPFFPKRLADANSGKLVDTMKLPVRKLSLVSPLVLQAALDTGGEGCWLYFHEPFILL